ncbi:MAG: glycoside hydrolase family 44 protein [Cystobacterineae bacterium]|nr:glycoside hydrolase family 44 protein [Cystobacterineae bacterium]
MTNPRKRAQTTAANGALGLMLGASLALCACKPQVASTPQTPPENTSQAALENTPQIPPGNASSPWPIPAAQAKPLATPALAVDCQAKPTPISPFIYGVAFDPQRAGDDTAQHLGATMRRWGGNLSTRFNWKLGNAWNTASDWYFRNVNYTGNPRWHYNDFLKQQRQWNMQTALSIPMLGWVAKDTTSSGFPLQQFPKQQAFDPQHPPFGNGIGPDGKPLPPGPPTLTSVPAPPEMMGEWVKTLRKEDAAKGYGRSVHLYFLDNEPNLWNQTHRDIHPEPLSYDELLEKTIATVNAIRKADPQALIAGPCEWGWTNFFWSAKDIAQGGPRLAPDRRAHDGMPLVPWYLKKLYEHQQKTGERMLDVLDLHHYPQGQGVGIGEGGGVDAPTSALRLRMTRSLWDPSYKEESWVNEKMRLIPLMREWVAENYPGLKLSLGEYNFGAENHPSGGLAQAEALGRFAQEGLDYAFAWYYPKKGSAAAQAFRAFRNYDGKGARFLQHFLPGTAPEEVSIFVSTNEARDKLVLVVLNLSATQPKTLSLTLQNCSPIQQQRQFVTRFDAAGLVQSQAKPGDALSLPPFSLAVVELSLAKEKP